jgi:dTDP-4-amino-4,6-dideoxygalactose transaminase
MIRFLDLRYQYSTLRAELEEAVRNFFESGHYILGSGVAELEARFADYVGVEYCVGVASGLDAIELLLRAYEIGPGDEVIVPSNTFIATWLAVSNVGATPVPVEPDIETFNIDPGLVEEAVTERTRAVLPVHLYGRPVEMTSLQGLAQAHDLIVLEDAAQAHGARHHGSRTGSLGHAGAFSFYPSKNLGAYGDAGAITTDDPEIVHRVRMLRNYGSPRKYENEIVGRNSRLDELQARLLTVKLAHLDAANQQRSQQAAIYLDELIDTSVVLPALCDHGDPVWYAFVVRSDSRDGLASHLAQADIETHIHYPIPPHLQRAYESLNMGRGSLPISERLHDTVLSLPIGPHLSEDDIRTVAAAVRDYAPR